MKIVITGHNSLLGSNLAKYFSVNNQVILLGTRNKKYKKYQFNYEYNHLDLNNLNVFFNHEKNIDLFIHCASINSKVCYKNSKNAFKFNVKFESFNENYKYLMREYTYTYCLTYHKHFFNLK